MALWTVEGVVENGQIRLRENVTLPERATVYVVVPNVPGVSNVPAGPQVLLRAPLRVYSPRLAHPQEAAEFVQQVTEGPADARL